jgi:hypothetical protein
MPEPLSASLPLRIAIDQVLRRVSFSNPVPEWYEIASLNYGARIAKIKKAIPELLGGKPPQAPFRISVPRRSKVRQTWIVPTVNDQIILHACVLAIARGFERTRLAKDRVFSYLPVEERDGIEFIEDQARAWSRFTQATRELPRQGGLLQIDLELVSESVNIDRLSQYIHSATSEKGAVELLRQVVKGLSVGIVGWPFVNDSLFFLLNAYLEVVDEVVGRYAKTFFRFVDDYRIADPSRERLEEVARQISKDLAIIGLRLNPRKTRVGSVGEFLDTLAAAQETKRGSDSLVPLPRRVLGAGELVRLVERSLKSPDEYMNDGFGRLALSAVRSMRVTALFGQGEALGGVRKSFSGELARRKDLVRRSVELLRAYADREAEAWRAVWLLYLLKDVDESDPALSRVVKEAQEATARSERVPPVVRYWARARNVEQLRRTGLEVEKLHEADYLEQGRLCCGGGG